MTDPNPHVEAITKNGDRVYIRRKSAERWGFKITDRPATDGHGRPKRSKPKLTLPKITTKPETKEA